MHRRILGSVYDNEKETRRILTNKEIYASVKKYTILETVRLNRLCWFGHVQRMDQANAAKSTVERTPKYKMEVGNTSIEVLMAKTGRELFTAVKMKQ